MRRELSNSFNGFHVFVAWVISLVRDQIVSVPIMSAPGEMEMAPLLHFLGLKSITPINVARNSRVAMERKGSPATKAQGAFCPVSFLLTGGNRAERSHPERPTLPGT